MLYPNSFNPGKQSTRRGSESLLSEVNVAPFKYSEFFIRSTSPQKHLVKTSDVEVFYYIHCSKGDISLTVNFENKQHIPSLHSGLVYLNPGEYLKIDWEDDTVVKLCIIAWSGPNHPSVSTFFDRFKTVFFKSMGNRRFGFVDKPYQAVANRLCSMSAHSQNRKEIDFFVEGVILQIIGLTLEQMARTSLKGKEKTNRSTGKFTAAINEIAAKIQSDVKIDYNLESVSENSGLSIPEVVDGFMKVYGKSLQDFVRSSRLEKAKELMLTTTMTFAQIVYSVGYTGRSYFLDIFEDEYGYSVSSFREESALKKRPV